MQCNVHAQRRVVVTKKARQDSAESVLPSAFTMPKEMTASEEYTRAQEQTSLERVFNNLDKKGDGKVRCSGNTCKPPAASNTLPP